MGGLAVPAAPYARAVRVRELEFWRHDRAQAPLSATRGAPSKFTGSQSAETAAAALELGSRGVPEDSGDVYLLLPGHRAHLGSPAARHGARGPRQRSPAGRGTASKAGQGPACFLGSACQGFFLLDSCESNETLGSHAQSPTQPGRETCSARCGRRTAARPRRQSQYPSPIDSSTRAGQNLPLGCRRVCGFWPPRRSRGWRPSSACLAEDGINQT